MTSQQRLRLGLQRLHVGGLSWRKIGKRIGESGGQTWFIAHGQATVDEETVRDMLQGLPSYLFWEDCTELDSLVLRFLRQQGRLTGRELGGLCGTTDRTIRKSIRRLRDAGNDIRGSTKPPRGYALEQRLKG